MLMSQMGVMLTLFGIILIALGAVILGSRNNFFGLANNLAANVRDAIQQVVNCLATSIPFFNAAPIVAFIMGGIMVPLPCRPI
jgi:hypothetical protein